MPFKNFIARLALSDAQRFEADCVGMLRKMLPDCPDARTKQLVQDLIAEEETHLQRLREADLSLPQSVNPPAEPQIMPEPPATEVPAGNICKRLCEVLAREKGSATFYTMLAQRTKIPAVREIFLSIGREEAAHAARLEKHLNDICGGCPSSNFK